MSRQRGSVIGLIVSALAVGYWLVFSLANGPARANDSTHYLELADAFARLHVESSIRAPGYPLFLVACRGLAGVLCLDFSYTVLVVQVLLLWPRLVPRPAAFHESAFMTPFSHVARPSWVDAVGVWRVHYRAALYSSFPLFVLMLAAGCFNGLGWPEAVAPFREVFAPYVVFLFAVTGLTSLGTLEVARLAISFHPFHAIQWGLLVTRVTWPRHARAD